MTDRFPRYLRSSPSRSLGGIFLVLLLLLLLLLLLVLDFYSVVVVVVVAVVVVSGGSRNPPVRASRETWHRWNFFFFFNRNFVEIKFFFFHPPSFDSPADHGPPPTSGGIGFRSFFFWCFGIFFFLDMFLLRLLFFLFLGYFRLSTSRRRSIMTIIASTIRINYDGSHCDYFNLFLDSQSSLMSLYC